MLSADSWHHDHNPSLTIDYGDRRDKLVACCDRHCAKDKIFAEAKAKGVEFFANSGARVEGVYTYCEDDGAPRYRVTRKRKPDGSKFFPQERYDPAAGSWIGGRGAMDGVGRLPYRLPELLAADPDKPVLVVEGEKHVDRLINLGFAATCNSEGAEKWQAEISRHLAGRDAVLMPDNDDAGRKHVADVARRLRGIAREIRLLELPGLPPKGDIIDWLDAGGAPEDLKWLVEGAPDWEVPPAPNGTRHRHRCRRWA